MPSERCAREDTIGYGSHPASDQATPGSSTAYVVELKISGRDDGEQCEVANTHLYRIYVGDGP